MNRFGTVIGGLLLLVALAVWQLARMTAPPAAATTQTRLLVYCAAGLRVPVEAAVQQYQQELGCQVEIQYGGTNSLLNQMEIARSGDLFLASDSAAMEISREKGLTREEFPIADQHPVIVVTPGNPRAIQTVADLLRTDVRTALSNPDQAAIGAVVRRTLQPQRLWEKLEQHVTRTGVFHPTVPEVANAVKLGSVDAGIVWDSTAHMVSGLQPVVAPEFADVSSRVIGAVLQSSAHPTEALQLARFLTARDRGLPQFERQGFTIVEGDRWQLHPRLTMFCGTLNRRVIEPAVKEFSVREGVEVQTVYNGCGILTAQMRAAHQGGETPVGFPDSYMACDRYYLNSVHDWFQEAIDVSDTKIVIAVPKGNPKRIRSVCDLAQPGIRVALGQPEQCTIGVLSRRMLRAAGCEEGVLRNMVQETTSSALLVPSVTTGACDAALVYVTDTMAESQRVDTIDVELPESVAVQPLAIAKGSDHKWLARRLHEKILSAPDQFEAAGFRFRPGRTGQPEPLPRSPSPPETP